MAVKMDHADSAGAWKRLNQSENSEVLYMTGPLDPQ